MLYDLRKEETFHFLSCNNFEYFEKVRVKKTATSRFLKRFINGLQEAVNLLFPKFSEGCCLTVWNEGYLEGNITPVVTEYIAETEESVYLGQVTKHKSHKYTNELPLHDCCS